MTQQASIRTQIIDNLCTRLVDGDNVKKVFRSMTQAVNAVDLPVCAVFTESEDSQDDEHDDGLLNVLRLKIVLVVAKTDEGNAALDQIADPATVWIQKTVYADRTMGGLATNARVPKKVWQLESGEFGFVGVFFDTEIEFYTLGDPSVSNR